MARHHYGPPGLGGPSFRGDDDELLKEVQLHEREWMIQRLHHRCRERYAEAETMLDHPTVLGLLAAGESRPPRGALLDAHDVIAAAWRQVYRQDNPNGPVHDDPDRGLKLTDEWLEAGEAEFAALLEYLPALGRHVLIAAVHHGSPLGDASATTAAAMLLHHYGFPADRVTEVG